MSRWFRTRFDARYKVDVTTGSFLKLKTGEEVFGSRDKKGYMRMGYAGKTRGVHVIIWAEANGRWPKSSTVPDANGDKWSIGHMDEVRDHNWAGNLREMTYAENNKMAAKNRDYAKILAACKTRKPVVATNLRTQVAVSYRSMYACSKALKINVGLISALLAGIGRTATSKNDDKDKYSFTNDQGSASGTGEQAAVGESGAEGEGA